MEMQIEMWQSYLQSLRSRFELAASKYTGVRCHLCRESYHSDSRPVEEAFAGGPVPTRALRDLLGAQVEGLRAHHVCWLSVQEVFHHWWFIHGSLCDAVSRARYSTEHGVLVYEASKVAEACEREFVELADEAAAVLKNIPNDRHPELMELLKTERLSYNHALWIVALFTVAKKKPRLAPLKLSFRFPNMDDLDVSFLDSNSEVPESVIQNLECNPFSGSVALIDLLLSHAEEKDGPCGTYQWRHEGVILQGQMSPASWRMVRYLWHQSGKTAAFDELKQPVYDDAEHIADSNAFGSLRREANRFFNEHDLPYKISIKKTLVSLQ